MVKSKLFPVFFFLLVCAGITFAAPVILNEYNGVSGSQYLNGGTATADIDGGYASDSYFGRVLENGGDWFELVVTQDHLDMRGWMLFVSYWNGTTRTAPEVLNLSNNTIWSNLRSGTIITISEDVPDNVSYNPIYDPLNPDAGDWWINVRANADYGTGTYIERQNFPVNNDDWQLTIKNNAALVQFGPGGEGIAPNAGVGNTEIFRLEANPSASIAANSVFYDDGINLSTFGSPNHWPGGNVQDFSQLRSVVPEPATALLLGLGSLTLLKKRSR
jgi:hypothetical protein